jgi:hypothetical protein
VPGSLIELNLESAMKKIILFSILLSSLPPYLMRAGKKIIQRPLIAKDTTGDFISGRDPESFLGKFVVNMYYGTAVKPQKADIVVIRNDNKANVRTIQANVTSFPSTIQVTGTQLTTLFDSTIKLRDKFEIGMDITATNG